MTKTMTMTETKTKTMTETKTKTMTKTMTKIMTMVTQVGGTLIIKEAMVEDSGKYLCMVNNSVGGESVETVLTVTGLDNRYLVLGT